jgi:hypothetical protein
MVTVFLKNGEKAPMLSANYVRIEHDAQAGGLVLRCRFNEREVGFFKWEEVAGYSIALLQGGDAAQGSNDAWYQRLERGQ